ncbi:MAG TPA: sigma-70 family RNA polymerase sigma factor [Anaerolineaceae bacterium]|nr:sigma-70 family RNA polymerase sigma factor [Anaerolineaceae bacterium]
MTDYSQFEDAQLIQYAHQDAKAFDVLYHRYLPRLYRYCLQRVNDTQQAEDISSQVFFEVLDGLMNGKYRESGCFAAWLFTIARRRVVDLYRKPEVEALQESHPIDPEISRQVEDLDDKQQLLDLIQELDEEQLELLRLRFAAELSFDEIAFLDGRKPAAVKMAIYRMLEKLRVRWEKIYGK